MTDDCSFITQELLSRSAAETRQLELLSDISSLKLRYAALEKDNMELRGQLKRSEQDMITLVGQVSYIYENLFKLYSHLLYYSATRCVEQL